jgi:predicted porin
MHFRLIEANDQDTTLTNAGHRIGLRGEGAMDNGTEFFYTIETEYKNDSGFGKNDGMGGNDATTPSSTSSTDLAEIIVRHANAGVRNKQGSVTVGRQNNPLNATYVADIFEANSGAYERSPYRIGHALVVKSNSMGGMKGYAGLILEGGASDTTNESLDGMVLGGSYSLGSLTINAGYLAADFISTSSNKSEFSDISIGVSYSMGEMYFGVNVESATTTDTAGADTDEDVIDLAATYTMGSVTYGVGYASLDDGSDTSTRTLLGAYVNLGGNTDCYFETGLYNDEAGDGDNYVLGYRVKF